MAGHALERMALPYPSPRAYNLEGNRFLFHSSTPVQGLSPVRSPLPEMSTSLLPASIATTRTVTHDAYGYAIRRRRIEPADVDSARHPFFVDTDEEAYDEEELSHALLRAIARREQMAQSGGPSASNPHTPVKPTRPRAPPKVLISQRTELICMVADRLFEEAEGIDIELVKDLACPLSLHAMRDPVACADGFCYERVLIERHFVHQGLKSPVTNNSITCSSLFPAHHIKKTTEWYVHRSLGAQCTDDYLIDFLGMETMPDATMEHVGVEAAGPSPVAPAAPRRISYQTRHYPYELGMGTTVHANRAELA